LAIYLTRYVVTDLADEAIYNGYSVYFSGRTKTALFAPSTGSGAKQAFGMRQSQGTQIRRDKKAPSLSGRGFSLASL